MILKFYKIQTRNLSWDLNLSKLIQLYIMYKNHLRLPIFKHFNHQLFSRQFQSIGKESNFVSAASVLMMFCNFLNWGWSEPPAKVSIILSLVVRYTPACLILYRTGNCLFFMPIWQVSWQLLINYHDFFHPLLFCRRQKSKRGG